MHKLMITDFNFGNFLVEYEFQGKAVWTKGHYGDLHLATLLVQD